MICVLGGLRQLLETVENRGMVRLLHLELLRETFQKDKRQSDCSGTSFRLAKAAFGESCGGAAL
jgi:hypothetical protein